MAAPTMDIPSARAWPASAFDNRSLPVEDARRGVYLKDTVSAGRQNYDPAFCRHFMCLSSARL